MAADDRAASLGHFCQSAPKNLLEDLKITLFRKRYDRERRDRPPSHRVNIAERIGCGDLAKSKGLIDNRSEEIQRLHQRESTAQAIHPGIIARLKANQDVVVHLPRQAPEHCIEDAGT